MACRTRSRCIPFHHNGVSSVERGFASTPKYEQEVKEGRRVGGNIDEKKKEHRKAIRRLVAPFEIFHLSL
jgi:hypothetical protein